MNLKWSSSRNGEQSEDEVYEELEAAQEELKIPDQEEEGDSEEAKDAELEQSVEALGHWDSAGEEEVGDCVEDGEDAVVLGGQRERPNEDS